MLKTQQSGKKYCFFEILQFSIDSILRILTFKRVTTKAWLGPWPRPWPIYGLPYGPPHGLPLFSILKAFIIKVLCYHLWSCNLIAWNTENSVPDSHVWLNLNQLFDWASCVCHMPVLTCLYMPSFPMLSKWLRLIVKMVSSQSTLLWFPVTREQRD